MTFFDKLYSIAFDTVLKMDLQKISQIVYLCGRDELISYSE